MAEFFEFVKNVGVPGGIAIFVLWRVDWRLAELVKAVLATNAVTPQHLEAALTASATKIITEVDHNTRAILANFDVRRLP